MTSATMPRAASLEEAAKLAPEQIVDLMRTQVALREEVTSLKHQLDWFKRQRFGHKSERRIVDDSCAQMSLGEDGNSLYGTAPEVFTARLAEWRADVDGLNCSVGPAIMSIHVLFKSNPVIDIH